MIPFIPHESPIHNRFEIDWKPGKIFEVTEETIGIMSPAIYDKKYKIRIRPSGVSVIRKVGVPNLAVGINNLTILTVLLVDDSQNIICALGFKELNKKE